MEERRFSAALSEQTHAGFSPWGVTLTCLRASLPPRNQLSEGEEATKRQSRSHGEVALTSFPDTLTNHSTTSRIVRE